MRTAILALMLFICALAVAQPQAERVVVADSVTSLVLQILPTDRLVSLEISADEWNPLLNDRLKTRLLADGIPVQNGSSLNGVTVEISCNSLRVPTRGMFDWSPPLTRHTFSIQVTDNTTGQIIAWRTLESSEHVQEPDSDRLRWYDPVLVTAVIGGLIYLFYFGAK